MPMKLSMVCADTDASCRETLDQSGKNIVRKGVLDRRDHDLQPERPCQTKETLSDFLSKSLPENIAVQES